MSAVDAPLALVTGGASLIGEATATQLGEDGWHVALADIDRDGAERVAGRLGNVVVATVTMDVGDRTGVTAAVDRLAADHGPLRGLVNVAGGLRGLGLVARPFLEMPASDWDRVLVPNLYGVLNVCSAVLPHLRRAGGGSIVSIAASRGLQGGAGASIYSAAKAAVIVFSQSLAQEVGPDGIRVNTIAPGNTEARWKTGDLANLAASPLGRETTAADVGDAVSFLMSDRAAHISGACLDVSGAVSLH
jgi:NAD(P)-dependent dehydrogenase (short-subunit alcohol dehydrogenase family)